MIDSLLLLHEQGVRLRKLLGLVLVVVYGIGTKAIQ